MNRIAVQTGGPEERLGVDETYRKVKEWGFDAVDANIDHLLGYSTIAHNEIPLQGCCTAPRMKCIENAFHSA